ncbi:PH domain-containing protein [Prosthecobacter sp.]|uniref:PH domain-containing protein n=1 Tax=Prosthecobacter sp. TaxID=1965333 RepID=UPI002ABA9992|nr:PH domain-containing protein [Prosthecobacter sp.]MDZ4404213.1 PH domain-containing protein [Prosthecobacter sp.]
MNNDDSSVPPSAETVLWSGHTSQWVHFWYYLFCIVIAVGIAFAATIPALFTGGLAYLALIIPLVMWLVRWWVTKCTFYELTSQRLRIRSGILNKRVDELELYRVKDYAIEQPLLLRLVGLGNLTMVTSDATTPTVPMRAIPGVEAVREKLRTAVQNERDRKRVRQLDVDSQDEGALK